ncbi:14213_t:CDS:1, partial [Rhizophagus irregularis]
FQEQVEELSQLIQKITKGKQKAANPKDMIIDWSGVEISDSPKKS